MTSRNYSFSDRLCIGLDQALRALSGYALTTGRLSPGAADPEPTLTPSEIKHVAGLMRVNHAGEISAQGLYHGQALASTDAALQYHLQQAAIEEGDHLAWCQTRLTELGTHASYLNPLFYTGSFVIGMMAGMVGDRWSLGFVAETERQVVEHLHQHLQSLPSADTKSTQILQQMQKDEAHHQQEAIEAGAATLPMFIQTLMKITAKVMVKTAYWF